MKEFEVTMTAVVTVTTIVGAESEEEARFQAEIEGFDYVDIDHDKDISNIDVLEVKEREPVKLSEEQLAEIRAGASS